MANNLQRAYDAVNRGSDRGMQRASQLQQLFAQKDQMERQKKQDDFAKKKYQVDMYTTWASSDNEYIRKQGMTKLTAFSKENEEFFNGTVNFLGIDSKNKGEENYEKLIKSLHGIKKQYESGEINDEAYSAALEEVGTDIAMLDPQYKKGAEQLQESRLSTVKNKIKMVQQEMIKGNIQRMQRPETGPPEAGVFGRSEYERVPEKPKTATTAMAAFLQKNPNATSKEISNYAQELRKPAASEPKPDYDKKLTELHKAKARLSSTKGADPLTIMMLQGNPEALKGLKNNDISVAIAEFDFQIKKNEALRNNGKLTKDLINIYAERANFDRKEAERLAKADGFKL